jgi:hypothetical protein
MYISKRYVAITKLATKSPNLSEQEEKSNSLDTAIALDGRHMPKPWR